MASLNAPQQTEPGGRGNPRLVPAVELVKAAVIHGDEHQSN